MLNDGVIVLKPPSDEDIEAVYEACQDSEVSRWTNVPAPYSRQDAVDYVRRRDPSRRPFVGYVDGRFAGSFSVMELDIGNRYGEIGYWVAAPLRRKGVATRAV